MQGNLEPTPSKDPRFGPIPMALHGDHEPCPIPLALQEGPEPTPTGEPEIGHIATALE